MLIVLSLLVGTIVAFFITEHYKLEQSPVAATEVDKRFSPVCRCRRASARISFQLTKSDRLAVEIIDRGSQRVRTLFTRRSARAGTKRLHWDGRDGRGRIVRDGVYRVRLELRGRTIVLPNEIRLDTKPPRIRLLAIRPRLLRLSGFPRSIHVSYRASEPSFGLLFVDGHLVVRTRLAATDGSLRWYGRTATGSFPPGVHRLRVALLDLAGNRSQLTAPHLIRIR